MILRKPYAILIKFFKLIHIVLFVISIYLMYKLQVIYDFFKEYVKTDVYTHLEDLSNTYIGPLMFLGVIVILVASVAIFYLMRSKEKPVLFYRILMMYGFSLIICLIVYSNFFTSLEFESYDRFTLGIYRDVIGVFYYLSYFFIVITFVRGFGFDIKKFSFEKDLKDLNITEEDSEEFEVSMTWDKDKIIEMIRREIRLSKYYFKENALSLLIIGGVVMIISGVIIYRSMIVTNIVYNQGTAVIANNLEYKVLNAYVTNRDRYNKDLQTNFVVVEFSVTNKLAKAQQIDLSKTRLSVGETHYYPVVNRYDSFSDLGNGYNKQSLATNITSEYILVFKLNNKANIDQKIVLEVYDNEKTQNSKLVINYKKIGLDKEYFETKDMGNYKLGEEINLSKSILEKGIVKVLGYEISNKFIHKYEECVLEECKTYDKVVVSNNNRKVIKLNVETTDIELSQIVNYVSLSYVVDGGEKLLESETLKNIYSDDKTFFLEVPYNFDKASNIIINFNVRGYTYKLLLDETIIEKE